MMNVGSKQNQSSRLQKELEQVLPSGMVIPPEILLLYEWIENQHFMWIHLREGLDFYFLK